jgi:hypothetical protein
VNERGIALPMSLAIMAILSSLMLALAALSVSEPAIASNHTMSLRARSFAESGVERAVWAVNNATGLGWSDPLPARLPAPYDGTQFVTVETVGGQAQGGFMVTVTPDPADANLVHITSVGYVPNAAAPRAIKKIQVDAMRVKFSGNGGTPPCALCLGGESPPGQQSSLQIGGSATVNASSKSGSPRASYCSGQTPTSAILSTGTVVTSGNPKITGPPGGAAIGQNAASSVFTPFTLTDAEMQVLKARAKAQGTYYQGSQTWTSPPPNGIVFVDTPSGQPFTASSPSSDRLTVNIRGTWTRAWSGWLIVAGTLDIQGGMTLTGLLYAQNDVAYNGTSTGRISGAIIAQNRLDALSSQVDSDGQGNGRITYNCPSIRNGGGAVGTSWFSKPGTYMEVTGT